MDSIQSEKRRTMARAWFEALRDEITAAFEALEDALPAAAPLADRAAGRFVRTPWNRTDHAARPGGGGVMAMMKGRVFEKVGVHASTVFGEFAPGISQRDSRCRRRSAVLGHRHFADRPSAESARAGRAYEHALHGHDKAWFGGGADLTPVLDRRRTQNDPNASPFTPQ